MKTFLAILFIIVVHAALSGSASAALQTYITNWSTRPIRASFLLGYERGTRDLLIRPHTWEMEAYQHWWPGEGFFDVEIWMDGNPSHGWLRLYLDRSVVAFDNGAAIDIYLAKYGNLIQIDDTQPEKLATIYPW